jgi:hypothetical protein
MSHNSDRAQDMHPCDVEAVLDERDELRRRLATVQLHHRCKCIHHGPTVSVEWTSGVRCPLCLGYEQELEARLAVERIQAVCERFGMKRDRDICEWLENSLRCPVNCKADTIP